MLYDHGSPSPHMLVKTGQSTASDERKIDSAEMRFPRPTAGHTLRDQVKK